MPGALKNDALDVGSRPLGLSLWSGKPTAVISHTTGALGAVAANQQVRLAMSVMNSPMLPDSEMYIPRVAGLFDESGNLNNSDTQKLVTGFTCSFDAWVQKFSSLAAE